MSDGKLTAREKALIHRYGPGSPPQAGTLYFSEYDPYEDLPDDPLDRDDLANARLRFWTLKRRREAQSNSDSIAGAGARSNAVGAENVSAPSALPRANRISVAESGKKRGKKPTVLRRVMEAMRTDLAKGALTTDALEQMLEKSLEQKYDASRDTCRKARVALLAESADLKARNMTRT